MHHLQTLCSRFVMVFRIVFKTVWNSFAGPTILLSISSSSGAINVLISSIVASNLETFRIVWEESGCFPIRSYSPALGRKRLAKCVAKPAPDVKRAIVHKDDDRLVDKKWRSTHF
jgi:hypothetical protein